MTVSILRVSNTLDLRGPDAWGSLDSTADQNFTSAGNLEMIFEDLGVLADSVDPPLALLVRQSGIFEEDRVHSELSFLGNETSGNTQSADTSGIVVPNDPQLSFRRHRLDLFNEFTFVPVEEVVDDDVGSEVLGKDGGGSEVPGNDDGLTSGELLDLDFLGRESLELRGKLLDGEGRESFLLGGSASG